MLDIKFIRENAGTIKQNCKNRRVDLDINALLELDEKRRQILAELEACRAEKNATSKSKPSEQEIEKMRRLGQSVSKMQKELEKMEAGLNDLLMRVPNLTDPQAPIGSEEDFVVLYKNREPKQFDFKPKTHEQLARDLNLYDFERGAKVAGSKFYFVKNDAVLLNQALLNYGIKVLQTHGFELMETPDLVNDEILQGSGFNPRGQESQVYEIADHDLNLIGTAEITVLGYHANETMDLSKGPKKYAALSHCFRTEAGSYGKLSKGLYRVHQFTKLEMFVFCKPNESSVIHQELLEIEKKICDDLNIPYRVIDIPSADLGGPAYRKFDIEAWMTMLADEKQQGGYGEITSCSNCTDFQARRLNIKYKNEEGESELAHTLNGTAMVLSRFPIAIMENFQQQDGTIVIPDILRGYVGKDLIGKKV